MNSDDLERVVRFHNGYDYRDIPNDQRGAHGAELHFILRGERGAIDAVVNTGWMHRPLVGAYMRNAGPQRRRSHPGVDHRLPDHYPTGSYIVSHCGEQRHDWWLGPTDCDILGGQCYGDIGYVVADTFLDRLLQDQEQGWQYLEEVYTEWLCADASEPISEVASHRLTVTPHPAMFMIMYDVACECGWTMPPTVAPNMALMVHPESAPHHPDGWRGRVVA